MKNNILISGTLIAAAVVATLLPSPASAKDPFGYDANYAAMQMYMQQQAQQQYGYSPYGNAYGYNPYGGYVNGNGNAFYGNAYLRGNGNERRHREHRYYR